MQYSDQNKISFHINPSPFPGVGVVEKCDGNENFHSTISLFI